MCDLGIGTVRCFSFVTHGPLLTSEGWLLRVSWEETVCAELV